MVLWGCTFSMPQGIEGVTSVPDKRCLNLMSASCVGQGACCWDGQWHCYCCRLPAWDSDLRPGELICWITLASWRPSALAGGATLTACLRELPRRGMLTLAHGAKAHMSFQACS